MPSAINKDKIVKIQYDNIAYGLQAGGYAVVKLQKSAWSSVTMNNPSGTGTTIVYKQSVTGPVESSELPSGQLPGSFESLSDTTVCTIDMFIPANANYVSKLNDIITDWDNIFSASTVLEDNQIKLDFYSKLGSDKLKLDNLYAIVKW